MRVLVVVEDDPDFRALVRITLAVDPRIVVEGEAADADEALALAEREQPELIVLDHFIDGTIMGLQLAPMLKRVAPGARILLFTTHDLAVEAAREPAVDRFLRKHDIAQLLPVAREMLGLD